MGDVPSLENVILLASVNVLCSSGANSRMTHPWKWGIFPCASDGMTRLRLRKSPFAGLVILLPTLLENRPSSRVVSASRERGPLSQQLKGRAYLLISLKKGLPKMRKKSFISDSRGDISHMTSPSQEPPRVFSLRGEERKTSWGGTLDAMVHGRRPLRLCKIAIITWKLIAHLKGRGADPDPDTVCRRHVPPSGSRPKLSACTASTWEKTRGRHHRQREGSMRIQKGARHAPTNVGL
jgi:hypothetical protein